MSMCMCGIPSIPRPLYQRSRRHIRALTPPRNGIRCPRIRHARVTHPHHLPAAQRPRDGAIRLLLCNTPSELGVVHVRGRLYNILPWNRNPMGRARGADDAPALPAMVLAVPEAELRLTDRAPADLRVVLPLWEGDVAFSSPAIAACTSSCATTTTLSAWPARHHGSLYRRRDQINSSLPTPSHLAPRTHA